MRKFLSGAVALSAALALGACGSTGSSKSSPTATTTIEQLSSPSWDKAGPTPSRSAKMVCEAEARRDIAATLGVKETRVTKPTWVVKDHLYSCTYVYPRGKVVLFVKEFSNEQATTAYYDSVLKHFGTIQPLKGLGQGAWTLKNNDIVARKDYKVLLVDVRGIAPPFGPSRMTRTDVALNVAAAIMGCWSGA